MMTYADLLASADARAWQNQANTQQNTGTTNALAQAQFDWAKQLATAGQTGMWNGQYNMPSNQYFANTFGSWMPGGPQAGQQTMAGQAQDWQQAFANSQAYGQYYAPGTTPYQGQQNLAAQNQANQLGLSQAGLTGYYNAPVQTANPTQFGGVDAATRQQYLQYNNNDPVAAANKWAQDASAALAQQAQQNPGQGTQTLAGQQQQWQQGFSQQEFEAQQRQLQQQNAQAYLGLLSNLRGPADWAKYQQVLGSTPGGMRDLAAAAMGQYTPGGGATTGYQPQAANLNTMQQQIAGQGNQQAWGTGIGVGGNQATPAQQQQATGNGTNTMGGQQQQYNLPAPNQIAAQSWQNMAPSQQQMLLGQYEANGWDKNDVQALYNQSLPKYGTNNASAGTWRLQ